MPGIGGVDNLEQVRFLYRGVVDSSQALLPRKLEALGLGFRV